MKAFKFSFWTLLILFSLSAAAQQQFSQPHISVSAKAEIEVEPDIIHLTIRLSESEGSKKMTVQQKEKVLKDILKELKIDQKNLTLMDALNQFDNSFWKKNQIKTSKTFDLKLTYTKTLNDVLLAMREKDLSEVTISKVDHSKKTELMKEARIKAVKAAKEKASYLTAAVDQKVGKLLYLSEQQNYFPRQAQMRNVLYAQEASTHHEQQISFKKITITAQVSAVFEIL